MLAERIAWSPAVAGVSVPGTCENVRSNKCNQGPDDRVLAAFGDFDVEKQILIETGILLLNFSFELKVGFSQLLQVRVRSPACRQSGRQRFQPGSCFHESGEVVTVQVKNVSDQAFQGPDPKARNYRAALWESKRSDKVRSEGNRSPGLRMPEEIRSRICLIMVSEGLAISIFLKYWIEGFWFSILHSKSAASHIAHW